MISKKAFQLRKKDGKPNSVCVCTTPELIENYDLAMADKTQTWICHHRLETHNSDGERRLVALEAEELIALGIYYNRPPEELIFMTEEEHTSLHHTGKILSKEHKKKLIAIHIGKSWWKGKHHSKEAKQKISDSKKKRVLCVETGVIYESLDEIERTLGFCHGNISSVCNGKRKTANGYHWQFV